MALDRPGEPENSDLISLLTYLNIINSAKITYDKSPTDDTMEYLLNLLGLFHLQYEKLRTTAPEQYEQAYRIRQRIIDDLNILHESNIASSLKDKILKLRLPYIVSQEIVSMDTIIETVLSNISEFPGYTSKKKKEGGANEAGKEGGIYTNNETGDVYLIKQDTKGKKVQHGKVIAEAMSGALLNVAFSATGIPLRFLAQVELIATQTGEKTKLGEEVYLKSAYINNYQGDLWKVAYEDFYKNKYRGNPRLLAEKLVALKTMKRPSGILPGAEVRKVIQQFLDKHPQLKTEIAEHIAARLVIAGDRGVHPGNFGIAEINGRPYIVSLDFGAGGRNLKGELKAYDRMGTGTALHKNHLLEYPDDVIYGEDMGVAFIANSNIPLANIALAAKSQLEHIRNNYANDLPAIKKYAKHLGIKSIPENFDDVFQTIEKFLLSTTLERQTAAKRQGYALLLEHCIDTNKNGMISQEKLQAYVKKYPELFNFLKNDFSKMPFLLEKNKKLNLNEAERKDLMVNMQKVAFMATSEYKGNRKTLHAATSPFWGRRENSSRENPNRASASSAPPSRSSQPKKK